MPGALQPGVTVVDSQFDRAFSPLNRRGKQATGLHAGGYSPACQTAAASTCRAVLRAQAEDREQAACCFSMHRCNVT